jgi:hypothetical protein
VLCLQQKLERVRIHGLARIVHLLDLEFILPNKAGILYQTIDGRCISYPSHSAWMTESRVLFKGARPSRRLTIEDAMLLME